MRISVKLRCQKVSRNVGLLALLICKLVSTLSIVPVSEKKRLL